MKTPNKDSCYFSGGPIAGRTMLIEDNCNTFNVPEATETGVVIHEYARADRYYPEREDQVFVYVGKKQR